MRVSKEVTLKMFIQNLWRSCTPWYMHLYILKTATGIECGTDMHKNFLLKNQSGQIFSTIIILCSVSGKKPNGYYQSCRVSWKHQVRIPKLKRSLYFQNQLTQQITYKFKALHGNLYMQPISTKKICSYSFAVAEKENMLKHFMDWLLKQTAQVTYLSQLQ